YQGHNLLSKHHGIVSISSDKVSRKQQVELNAD
ncbi:unnamed protein product, partial [marine sediment metagenome]